MRITCFQGILFNVTIRRFSSTYGSSVLPISTYYPSCFLFLITDQGVSGFMFHAHAANFDRLKVALGVSVRLLNFTYDILMPYFISKAKFSAFSITFIEVETEKEKRRRG